VTGMLTKITKNFKTDQLILLLFNANTI